MPKRSETFEQMEVDGIKVYYRGSMADVFSKVIVKVEKFLFFEYLVVAADK